MKYFNFSKSLAAITAGVLLLSSCDKVETPAKLGDAGQTIVKIMEADKRLINIELVSTSQVLNMVDIRRDIPNEAELNKTMKVIVKDDPGAVSDYNAANSTTFIPIPAAQYLIDAANPKVGTDYTVTMNPGEFAKWLKFSIPNALALDLNKTYAFGFSISTVDAGGKISNSAKTIVVEIGVKNQWDGVYRMKGKFYLHPTYGPLAGFETDKIELHTAGATALNQFCTIWGEYCQPFTVDAAGTLNRFGALGPQYVLNPTTNAVAITNNAPGNTTGLSALPAGVTNRYDPVTKTFYVSWGYLNAAGAARYFSDTLTFIRAR
jgi:Domain of unknown function (DUF1735)